MKFRDKALLSGLGALFVVALLRLLQDQLDAWLSPVGGITLVMIMIFFVGPGLATGNGNFHGPVGNDGGVMAADFIIFFPLLLCVLCLPSLLRVRKERPSFLATLLR